ncbi:FmdE family protein [Desulfobacter vibrioformis]|uniref:FmdE family protein n=1 Tax=Desulfobacter vibrioformis TaxID=34031 RepID=UPI00055171A1|nr:FmdE family protein [Desulfobacter vibrioformis]
MNKDILKNAFEFHGHICWDSAAGVRAGTAALRQLNVARTGSSAGLHCILEIGENHGAQWFATAFSMAPDVYLGKVILKKPGGENWR